MEAAIGIKRYKWYTFWWSFMIPPKNHAFFVSQTFTRHCNFRTSLLLLIASGALTGSCCSRAESSAAWALHHRHHYHHLPTVRASASTFITYSSDIHQFILCCQRFVKVSNLFAEIQVCPACACSGGGSVPSRISLPNAAEQLQKLKDMLQEWTCWKHPSKQGCVAAETKPRCKVEDSPWPWESMMWHESILEYDDSIINDHQPNNI